MRPGPYVFLVIAALMPAGAKAQSGRDRPTFAGTYRIAVCKLGPCSLADTSRAISWGILVLADSSLNFDQASDSSRRLLSWERLRGVDNGCYVLRPPSRNATSYAGIGSVGATTWSVDSLRPSEITFGLYHSPDAGHGVRAQLLRDTLRGRGGSWGAGVAAVDWPADTIVGVRTGPPSRDLCTEASAREWRRIRSGWRPSNEEL